MREEFEAKDINVVGEFISGSAPAVGPLERALNSIGSGLGVEKRVATRIVDVASEAEGERIRVEWEREQRWEAHTPQPNSRADEWREDGPGAPIERSRHAGRVLSVR